MTRPAVEVAVGDAQPAALGDAEPGAVEHLEHGEVAQHDGDRDRVVAVPVVVEVDGVGGVVEQVVRPRRVRITAGEAAGALRGAEASRPGSWSMHAVAAKEAQVGARARRPCGRSMARAKPRVSR